MDNQRKLRFLIYIQHTLRQRLLCSKLTLVIDFHIISYGCGRGRGTVAARRLSRWHMLSYDNMMDDHSDCGKVCSISNSQDRTIRKTWEGDSDLWVKKSSNEYDEHIDLDQYTGNGCFSC